MSISDTIPHLFLKMFGREAAEILDYVECFPDGYRKGIQIAKACKDVKIEGFPTWVISGQVIKYFHIHIFPFFIPTQTRCNCYTLFCEYPNTNECCVEIWHNAFTQQVKIIYVII